MSLIEVLVALAVGLLLLAAAVGMFISNQRVYREQQMMSRLQEDMRYTVDTLLFDIRMAGHLGCGDRADRVQIIVQNPQPWAVITDNNTLEGMEGKATTKQWEPGTDTGGIADALTDTDGIGMRFMQPTGVEITTAMTSASAALNVAALPGGDLALLEQNGSYAISDCRGAEVFVASGDPTDGTVEHAAGSANTSASFSRVYDEDANLYRFVSRRYLVQGIAGDANRPGLFRIEYAQDVDDSDGDGDSSEYIHHSQLLVEGVENMQLAYLAGGTEFETADDVGNWGNVTAVRLVLLFRTVEENFHLTADSASYTLLGGATEKGDTAAAASDFRRRRVFSTTIQVRNRNS